MTNLKTINDQIINLDANDKNFVSDYIILLVNRNIADDISCDISDNFNMALDVLHCEDISYTNAQLVRAKMILSGVDNDAAIEWLESEKIV